MKKWGSRCRDYKWITEHQNLKLSEVSTKKYVEGQWRVRRHERRKDRDLDKFKIVSNSKSVNSDDIWYWILGQRERQSVTTISSEGKIKQGVPANFGSEKHSCNQK